MKNLKNILSKLRVLCDFVISTCLTYVGLTLPMGNVLLNIILIVVALFVLIQALGLIDKLNGYGDNKS